MGNALDDKQYSLEPQVERRIGFAAVGAAYVLVGTKFLDGIVTLYIYTSLNQEMKISLDGTDDWMTLPAGVSAFILDAKSNKAPIPGKYGIYVKHNGIAPTSGTLYITAMTVV
jgi:hypothetical protein